MPVYRVSRRRLRPSIHPQLHRLALYLGGRAGSPVESSYLFSKNPLLDSRLELPESGEMHKYSLHLPRTLAERHRRVQDNGGSQPIADLTLCFGLGPETGVLDASSLLRRTDRKALIEIPAIETSSTNVAWGIGIDAKIIRGLLGRAGVPGIEWRIKVISAYGTGRRGLDGTVGNATQLGLDLSEIDRAVFFDCLDTSDDTVSIRRAIDTLLRASPDIELVVYRVTGSGSPGDARARLPVAIPERNRIMIDVSGPEKFAQLRVLSAARLIDDGLRETLIKESDLPASVLDLVRYLPERGSLVTGEPGPGQTNLNDWLARPRIKQRIRELDRLHHEGQRLIEYLIDLALEHELLGDGKKTEPLELVRRCFAQEICGEYLV